MNYDPSWNLARYWIVWEKPGVSFRSGIVHTDFPRGATFEQIEKYLGTYLAQLNLEEGYDWRLETV